MMAANQKGHAPLARRGMAFAVDYMLLGVYASALVALWQGVRHVGMDGWLEPVLADPVRGHLLGVFLLTLPVAMYHAVWEGSPVAGTPGKRLVGLVVHRPQGGRIPLEAATARSLVKVVPLEGAHALFWWMPVWFGAHGISVAGAAGLALLSFLAVSYLLAAALDPDGQGPHDRVAGSVVVRAPRRPHQVRGLDLIRNPLELAATRETP